MKKPSGLGIWLECIQNIQRKESFDSNFTKIAIKINLSKATKESRESLQYFC